MRISTPREPVYYYECSYGTFRLLYCIPPGHLKRLARAGKVSSRAVEDSPDGMEIGMTEADCEQFADDYDFRVPLNPGALRRAFYALLSSTREWRSFCGTGFVPAPMLEQLAVNVDAELEAAQLWPQKTETLPERPSQEERRKRLGSWTSQVARADSYLERLTVEGIDPNRSLCEQRFAPIKRYQGKSDVEVFPSVYQRTRSQKDDR